MKLILLFLLFIAQCIFYGQTIPIVDGVIVSNIKNYHYVVHLTIITHELQKRPRKIIPVVKNCGGIIIRANVILTVAHCLNESVKKHRITVQAGTLNRNDYDNNKNKRIITNEGQQILVEDFVKHKDFSQYSFDEGSSNVNDIAILWLEKSFQINSNVNIASLIDGNYKNVENKTGIILGWGQTDCGESASTLRKGSLRIVSQENCQQYFKTKITDKFICAISDKKTCTSSLGDSGGPFIIDGKIVGLISFGYRKNIIKSDGTKVCSCDPEKPSVITNLSKYSRWIDDTLKGGQPSKNPSAKLPPRPPARKRT